MKLCLAQFVLFLAYISIIITTDYARISKQDCEQYLRHVERVLDIGEPDIGEVYSESTNSMNRLNNILTDLIV